MEKDGSQRQSWSGRSRAARRRYGPPLPLMVLAAVAAVLAAVFAVRRLAPRSGPPAAETPPAATPEITEAPDTEGPVISGVKDLTAEAGGSVSYRDGVTAVDERDGAVALQVDSSGVDLSRLGEYPVVYWAEDSSGNRTEAGVTLTVTAPEPKVTDNKVSREELDALADGILAGILSDGMTQKEQARAIFDYIVSHTWYVGTSDKSNWIDAAYTGFTTGHGDCYNYYACSKALLSRAGIPTVDVQRVGGNSRHYWVLADTGEGYCHFDPCPHPKDYPLTCFLLTEREVRDYTELLAAHSDYYQNYYTYDYENCPVTAVSEPPSEGTEP